MTENEDNTEIDGEAVWREVYEPLLLKMMTLSDEEFIESLTITEVQLMAIMIRHAIGTGYFPIGI